MAPFIVHRYKPMYCVCFPLASKYEKPISVHPSPTSFDAGCRSRAAPNDASRISPLSSSTKLAGGAAPFDSISVASGVGFAALLSGSAEFVSTFEFRSAPRNKKHAEHKHRMT